MSTRYDLVLTGDVVLAGQVLANGWVAVSDGKITAIGSGTPPDAAATHNADNGYIIPGVVDGQTHAGSANGLAGLEATTRSAVAGGVTTIVDMPYDDPDPVDTLARLRVKQEAIGRYAHCDVALYATIPRGGVGELLAMVDAGVCAVKISSFESHATRFPRIPADEMLDLLETVADTDIPVGLHNEDQEIVRSRIARMKAAGRSDASIHSDSRPLAAEMAETARFLELGAITGAHVHIVHFSDARGYQLVERYLQDGNRATAEICVHYLHFDGGRDTPRLGNLIKVNPPIRAGQIEPLWKQLNAGRIAFVSSDHGSWPLAKKQVASVFDAGAGIPGLETLLPSFYTDLARRSSSAIETAVEYLCEKPARFFGLWPQKGEIAIGADADLAIVEKSATRFDARRQHGDQDWSPYDGETFDLRVRATFVRGSMAFDGEHVVSPAGYGEFVARRRSA